MMQRNKWNRESSFLEKFKVWIKLQIVFSNSIKEEKYLKIKKARFASWLEKIEKELIFKNGCNC